MFAGPESIYQRTIGKYFWPENIYPTNLGKCFGPRIFTKNIDQTLLPKTDLQKTEDLSKNKIFNKKNKTNGWMGGRVGGRTGGRWSTGGPTDRLANPKTPKPRDNGKDINPD